MADEKETKETRYVSFDRQNINKKNRVTVAKKDGKVLYTIVEPIEDKEQE